MLSEVTACPMCGSSNIAAATHNIRQEEGWKYLSQLFQLQRQETLERAEEITIKCCRACGVLLYSPWFEIQDCADAFATRISRHQSGWLNLQHVLLASNPGSYQQFNAAVTKHIGDDPQIKKYAELGCPFSGMNALQFFLENQKPRTRIKKYTLANKKQSDSRNRFHVRWFDLCSNILTVGIGIGMRVEAFIRTFFRQNDITLNCELPTKRAEKFILTQNSSFGWGSACEAMGQPCHSLAAKLFKAKVLPFEDAKRSLKFDMIGIYNFFDHLSSPLDTLDACTEISKLIVITVHKPEFAGKQHRVIIMPDFAEFLQGRYQHFDVCYFPAESFREVRAIDQYQVFILREKL